MYSAEAVCVLVQQKLNVCMRTGNLVSRLQAKYNALQKALGEGMYDVPAITVDRFT